MAFEHRFHSGLTARIDGRGCEQRLVWIAGENSHEEAVAVGVGVGGRWAVAGAGERGGVRGGVGCGGKVVGVVMMS
jgi:hypothetical protein